MQNGIREILCLWTYTAWVISQVPGSVPLGGPLATDRHLSPFITLHFPPSMHYSRASPMPHHHTPFGWFSFTEEWLRNGLFYTSLTSCCIRIRSAECIACFTESVAILHNEVRTRSCFLATRAPMGMQRLLQFLLNSGVSSLALACWGTEDFIIILTTSIISVSQQYYC